MSRLISAVVVTLALVLVPVVHMAPAHAEGPEMRAVLVGINQFLGKTRPNIGGVGDVNAVRTLLLRSGWPESGIRVLTDGQATAANIRSGLQWLSGNKAPDSHSVFFYSGHTKQMPGDLDRDGEALDEYYWPHDNQFISDGEVATYLKGIGGYAWIGVAACEASGFDDGVSSDKRIFTAASLENEKGYEYPAWSQSVWTGLFVDQGMLQGKADANHNGEVTLTEASAYAERLAPQMTANQVTGPQHVYYSGGGGQDRTLSVPQPAPQPSTNPGAPQQPGLPPLCLGELCLPDLSSLLPKS